MTGMLIALLDLDAAIRGRLGAPEDLRGVVVTAIAPGSPAAFMGLRVGDVIVEVNRTNQEGQERD